MMKAAGLALSALLLVGCSGSPPAASTSPSPPATPVATATPTSTPTSRPTAAPTATTAPSSSAATCTAPIDSAHNLVLATLAGSTQAVLRDITDTAAAQTLCTFAGAVAPRFVTASVVSWTQQGSSAGSAGQIVRLDLASGAMTTVASWTSSSFGSGIFDWSPDGGKLTYMGTGGTWHLLSGGTDRVLSTLPAVPGRGVDRQNDDFFLGFSPDSQYVAMVQTFATGGSGETAPVQVRRVSDGAQIFSNSGQTMGVWASKPGSLFFRDPSGRASEFNPIGRGLAPIAEGQFWVEPHASPDGRWIAYTKYDSGGLPHVGLFSVQGNSAGPQPAGLRSGAVFLNNDLVWYQEETPCDCGLAGASQLSGRTFIYDIAGAAETASRITGVYDVWPRITAPPGLG